jgi:hypothetical protein
MMICHKMINLFYLIDLEGIQLNLWDRRKVVKDLKGKINKINVFKLVFKRISL